MGDAGLSAVGHAQARATARYLRDRAVVRVYASPLRRAKETAAIIAASRCIPVIEDGRLRERANWGDLPGQSFVEFVAMWECTTHDPTFLPPIGDSAAHAGERMASFIRDVGRTNPHAELVAVTHGGVLTDFLVRAIPEEELERWYPSFIANQSRLIAECSITAIECDGTQFALTSFATTGHLA